MRFPREREDLEAVLKCLKSWHVFKDYFVCFPMKDLALIRGYYKEVDFDSLQGKKFLMVLADFSSTGYLMSSFFMEAFK